MLVSKTVICNNLDYNYIVTDEECKKLHKIAHDYGLSSTSKTLWPGVRAFGIRTFNPKNLVWLKKAKKEIEAIIEVRR